MAFKPIVPPSSAGQSPSGSSPSGPNPSSPTSGPGAGPGGPRPGGFPRPRGSFDRGGGRGGPGFGGGKDDVRINERIRVPEVRLIGENGEQHGIVNTMEAMRMAREKGLDLMEVSPTSRPPVCKLVDYGKFKYEKKKKEHQSRKKQVTVKVKELQFRPNTEEHDLDYKTKAMRGFLEEGDKCKITIMFRGREIAHPENGYKIMKEIVERLKDISVIESPTKLEGKKMILIIAPIPKKSG